MHLHSLVSLLGASLAAAAAISPFPSFDAALAFVS